MICHCLKNDDMQCVVCVCCHLCVVRVCCHLCVHIIYIYVYVHIYTYIYTTSIKRYIHIYVYIYICINITTACKGDSAISIRQVRAVCCSVLQCVAVCCSALQCVAVCCSHLTILVYHIFWIPYMPHSTMPFPPGRISEFPMFYSSVSHISDTLHATHHNAFFACHGHAQSFRKHSTTFCSSV